MAGARANVLSLVFTDTTLHSLECSFSITDRSIDPTDHIICFCRSQYYYFFEISKKHSTVEKIIQAALEDFLNLFQAQQWVS